MRYRLRTLLIAAGLAPPVIAAIVLASGAVVIFGIPFALYTTMALLAMGVIELPRLRRFQQALSPNGAEYCGETDGAAGIAPRWGSTRIPLPTQGCALG